ncbi:MAG: hypothetical protein ACREOH_17305, partial [Candidatus Entotheonellia bacterium]
QEAGEGAKGAPIPGGAWVGEVVCWHPLHQVYFLQPGLDHQADDRKGAGQHRGQRGSQQRKTHKTQEKACINGMTHVGTEAAAQARIPYTWLSRPEPVGM